MRVWGGVGWGGGGAHDQGYSDFRDLSGHGPSIGGEGLLPAGWVGGLMAVFRAWGGGGLAAKICRVSRATSWHARLFESRRPAATRTHRTRPMPPPASPCPARCPTHPAGGCASHRAQRLGRRAHPGGRSLARGVRGGLPAQRGRQWRGAAALAHHGALRRRRCLLARADRLHLHGEAKNTFFKLLFPICFLL